jgi:TPR repeat protein
VRRALLAALAATTSLLGCAGKPASHPPGEAAACPALGAASPLALALGSEARTDLGHAMDAGIAVVAYDCRGLRVLPKCRARGSYGTIGVVPRRQTIDLATPAEIADNMVGDVAGLGGSLRLSTHVAALIIASRAAVDRRDLEGACEGATHFLKEVELGVVARGGEAAAACWSGEGMADVDEVRQCGGVVRMALQPLGPPPEYAELRAAPPVACPRGTVLAEGRCAAASRAPRHRCAFGDGEGCRAQCAGGDAASCAALGYMHLIGRGVEKAAKQAYELSLRACDGGDRLACANAAMAADEIPEPRPKVDVFDLYERSCTRGDAEACYGLGRALDAADEKQAKLGEALLSRACRAGSPEACVELGARLYAKSEHTLARAIFTRACDAGEQLGCVNLGIMTRDGEGAAANVARAAQLFDDACRAGSAFGCAQRGLMLRDGQGAEQDYLRAAELFDVGCRGEVGFACNARGNMHEQALGAPRDLAAAERAHERGCTLGDAGSCNELGRLRLAAGQDQAAARAVADLFRRACEGGEPAGCFNLGTLTAEGHGAPKDAARAKELADKACKGGFTRACKPRAGDDPQPGKKTQRAPLGRKGPAPPPGRGR